MEVITSSFSETNFTLPVFANFTCIRYHKEVEQQCWSATVWLIVSSLISLMGSLANFLVLFVLIKTRENAPRSDLFVMNLALVDVCFCLSIPLSLLNYFILHIELVSNFVICVLLFDMFGAPVMYGGLCAERYFAVVWATRYVRWRSLKYRLGCCAAVWIITLPLSFRHIASRNDLVKHFNIYISVLYPVYFTTLFCNLSILKVLRTAAPGTDKIYPIKKQAIRTVLIVSLLVVATYTPILSIYPFQNYFPIETYQNIVLPVCLLPFTLRSCCQSFLYLHFGGKISYIKNLLKTKCSRK